MRRSVLFSVLACSFLMNAACTHTTYPNLTATGLADLRRDQIVIRINEFQATVIEACGQVMASQCAPNTIPTALAVDGVQAAISARNVIKAQELGWFAALQQGWTEFKARYPQTNPVIQAAESAVDAALAAYSTN